jgi:hypothetical protein
LRPKNAGPDQRLPVIRRATCESDPILFTSVLEALLQNCDAVFGALPFSAEHEARLRPRLGVLVIS